MKKYEQVLSEIIYPEDIEKIKKFIPEIIHLKDFEIQTLYMLFSDGFYSAGWLIMDEDTLKHFKSWILKEV